jgi:UDP-N-acetylglucosamine 2-epimerase
VSPSIDMRVALTNPITLDKFNVLRRAQQVSDHGRVSVVVTPFNNVHGIVTPSLSVKDLQRMTDAQIQSKALAIVTRFALRGEAEVLGQEFQPDLILWHGNTFLVVFVEDYSNYAAGFVRAVAVMMDIQVVPEVTT